MKLLIRCLLLFIVPFHSYGEQFERLTLDEIVDEMRRLASLHPDLVSYSTAQEKYDLPKTCNFNHYGCWNHILTITDSKIYSKKLAGKARKQRPDVLISGALHGNERVGPVATIEVAKLLATAASCESRKAPAEVGCDEFYSKHTKREAAWLARLVSTRRIVLVPAANSNGYYYNRREEQGFDPNRDFPFDQMQSSTNERISRTCMRTITARTINELFHDHLFQMALTYHGGMESITYEWGATSVPENSFSPDHKSQDVVAMGLAQFAGKLYPNQLYVTGDTNSIIYSVRGGFEDWAYAGSWAKNLVNKCNPQTYNGYDLSKTTYNNATLRAFNIIIETSTNKNPVNNALGTDKDLLSGPFSFDNFENNGYVAKHIRTSLLAIDVVEPYVEIIQCMKKKFISELKPLVPLKRRWSKKKKSIYAKSSKQPRISWTVGGSFQVDETFLVYGLWTDFPNFFNGIQQLKESQLEIVLDPSNSAFSTTPAQSGGTRWSSSATDFGAEQVFTTKKVDLSRFSAFDEVAVFAFAKVDQAWADRPANVWPNIGIQSHMANGRTNPDYTAVKWTAGRVIQGRHHWISIPLNIIIKPSDRAAEGNTSIFH